MKIAITCPASLPATPFGGILMVAVNLAKNFYSLGHDTTIYTTDLNFNNKKMVFDKNLSRIDNSNGFKIKRSHVILKIYNFFITLDTYNQLKQDNPELIHVIGIRSFQAFMASLVAKYQKIPMILSDYGGITTHPDIKKGNRLKKILYKIQNPMIKFVMKQADMIIAANEFEVEDFSNIKNNNNFKIIKNGIDNELLKTPKFNFKEKFSIEEKILLFVGRFDQVKGIDVLLDAFSEVCANKKFSNVKLILMGSDFGFKEKMSEQIKQLKLEKHVKIIENPLREEVISAYHSCEFLVLPSRWELSPLTPLEGFACKKTSISCDVAGIPFVITNKENGLLVESENSNELKNAIIELLTNDELRNRLAENGFNEVQEKLNSQFMVEQFLTTYKEILEKYKN